MSRGPGVLQRRILEVLARERHRALDTREVAHLCGLFEDDYRPYGELEEELRREEGRPPPRTPLPPDLAAELVRTGRTTPPPSAMRNALRALTRLHEVHPNVCRSYWGRYAEWQWIEADEKRERLAGGR